jgi:hypothetical protein
MHSLFIKKTTKESRPAGESQEHGTVEAHPSRDRRRTTALARAAPQR